MFCEKCGNKIPEDAKFCPKCGTPCSDDNNVPENNGGTKAGKKTKKHGKKSKVVIALCTVAVVVGVSVGGVALYKNHGEPSVIQKANDLDVAWGVTQNFSYEISNEYADKHPDKDGIEQYLDCKIDYNTAQKYIEKTEKNIEKRENDLEEETNKKAKEGIKYDILVNELKWNASYYNYDDVYNWHDKVSDMKNVYTLYTSAGDGDIYSGLIFEQEGLVGEIDNLTDKDYSWMFLDSYRIKDGKIYGEQNVHRSEEQGDGEYKEWDEVYKIEGKLLDQDILIEERLKETQEDVKKNKEKWTKSLKENYRKQVSIDEALKEYEKYLNKWKNVTKVKDDDYDRGFILYKIKDYKDGTLIADECYRPVPTLKCFLAQKYEIIK